MATQNAEANARHQAAWRARKRTEWEALRRAATTPSAETETLRKRVAELEQALADKPEAELAPLRKRIAELEQELVRVERGGLPKTREEWVARKLENEAQQKALRKARKESRRTNETAVDEKTKEDYERQIKQLRGRLTAQVTLYRSLAKVEKGVLTDKQRRGILSLLHPDRSQDPEERAKREEAFKDFSNVLQLDPRTWR